MTAPGLHDALQDTIFAIPEFEKDHPDRLQVPELYKWHPSYDTSWVAQVITFFKVNVRDSEHGYKVGTRLAFVHWAETYMPVGGDPFLYVPLPVSLCVLLLVRSPAAHFSHSLSGLTVLTHAEEETHLELLVKSRRVYWPSQQWYDVIECSRILGMCPTVPDFANDGKVPKPLGKPKTKQTGPKSNRAGPQPGDRLVYRNSLARGFGRPSGLGAHEHSGDVVA